MNKEEIEYPIEEELEEQMKINKNLQEGINKAIKFVETQHNTYPSAKEWRKALIETLMGENNE